MNQTLILSTWREPGKVAIEEAWRQRTSGADLMTCLEKGLAAAELDPSLLAIGLGSLPNADGELELDAAIMDGRTLNAGAVCSVKNMCPVISVARRVLEDTPHVMLSGEQAKRFALSKGFQPINLMTEANIKRYDEWRSGLAKNEYVHTAEESHRIEPKEDIGDSHDTVTMLGMEWGHESEPHLVAASATSGLAWKLPGRVGDSPIVGAGVYADDEIGAAGATGWGEELWKAVASFRTVEFMRQGMSAQEACEATVRHMLRRQPNSHDMACVVMAIKKDGSYGAATTAQEFPQWICLDGEMTLRLHPPTKLL